jgi:ribosomal protein L37AE/L43A
MSQAHWCPRCATTTWTGDRVTVVRCRICSFTWEVKA